MMDAKLKIAVDALEAMKIPGLWSVEGIQHKIGKTLAAIDADQPEDEVNIPILPGFSEEKIAVFKTLLSAQPNDLYGKLINWENKLPEGEAAPQAIATLLAKIKDIAGNGMSHGLMADNCCSEIWALLNNDVQAVSQAVEAPAAWGLLSIMDPEVTTDAELAGYWARKGRAVTPLYAAPLAPQAVEVLGSIDTPEFRTMLADLQGWKDGKPVMSGCQEAIAHIDASRREAWEMGRAYGVAQSSDKS